MTKDDGLNEVDFKKYLGFSFNSILVILTLQENALFMCTEKTAGNYQA